MDLGLFMMPLHDARRNYTSMLEQDRQAIIYADQLGYQEAWVGEHYSCSSEPICNPLQFFATLIHATKNIKFATGVIALPQHHPAMIAGDVAQFDHLSKGRFILGVGPGGLVSDFELFKTTDLNRAAMATESIEIIKKIWSSDAPYHIKGKFWEVNIEKNCVPSLGFGPMLKPYQKGGPPIAISVMSPSSSSARQAGENDWEFLSANFIQPRHAKSHWEQYVIGCEKAGRRPDRSKWRIARSIVVGESDQQIADYLARPDTSVAWYYEYIVEDMKLFNLQRVLKGHDEMADSELTTQYCLDTMVIKGGPRTVLDQLVAFVDEMGGPFGGLLFTQKDWDDAELHKNSMRLLAHNVMPQLRDYCLQHREAAE